MRTTPALRTLAAALLVGGTLAVSAAGTTAAASPTYAEGHGHGHGHGHSGSTPGIVVSRTDLSLRQAPTTHSPVAGTLAPGSHVHVKCMVRGQSVNGNPNWYWLTGARAWASAAFVDTGGARVPACADPCPQWKDGHWTNWEFSFSSSWSFSASGTSGSSETSSGGWEWVPVAR
jgi:hypothetical protein